MPRLPISVLIPCFNSQDVIEDCLKSVAWADEIFVCDSFSTDATLEICRRYTDHIVQHEYVNSATQKNWAIPQARHDWVLIVDTDERVSPALRREIEATLTTDCPFDGFKIPRLNHVFGRPIHHGGHYPDYQLRLFRRDRARYQERQVHAHVELQGSCGTLTAPLIHFGQRSVDQVTRTYLLRYTAWEAAQKHADGVRFRASDLLVRPLGAFVVRYLRQRGFLDGTAGLFMALTVSAYVFLTYARLWQLQSTRHHDPDLPSPAPHPAGRLSPTAPLRAAFLVPHTSAGGAEVNLRSLLSHLDQARVSPTVLIAGQGPAAQVLAVEGAALVQVPTPRFFSTSLRLPGTLGARTLFNPLAVLADILLLGWAALAYARALRRARAQVVHTGSIFAHLLGVLCAPLAGARLVWHVQDIVSPRLGGGLVLPFFTWLGAHRAALIICPSEAVAASLRACWPPRVPPDRLRVVPNGIDVALYAPGPGDEGRAALSLPLDAFVAIHVGRLVPWKGQREFLHAARLVHHAVPTARFLVVGDVAFDGPAFRDELHDLVRRLGIADRVVFTGWRSDVPVLISAADVLVHSSVLPEPFGLVLVEAMALQRPVVASNLGGPGEIIREGEDGLLVDPRNPEQIAAAILRLARDPALRERMGQAARARAFACFGAERYTAGVAEALSAAAGLPDASREGR